MSGLTGLDIIVLLLIAIGGVFGFSRGFVQEALSLIAWVLGIFAVRLFHTPAQAIVQGFVETESGASVLAFVLLFGIVFGLGKWLSTALGKQMRNSALGGLDRTLGAGFGTIKGLIVATLLFLLLTLGHGIIFGKANAPDWIAKSRTYPLLNASSAAISDVVDAYQGEKTEQQGAAAKKAR
jgi:membrane protein required for colicin V production